LVQEELGTLDLTTVIPYHLNLNFEWNKSKARDNFAKHGVSFELAKRAFDDPFALEFLDDREDYDEQRFAIIGMVEGRIFYVVYAERRNLIRIISARSANRHEQETYLEENA
jgi:uncharacterized DUF497 family protein